MKQINGIDVYESLPEGWIINTQATTAPRGYVWINNKKDLFGGEYKHGLMKTGEEEI